MKSKIVVLLSSFLILFGITLINSCSGDDPQPIPTASFTASKTTANIGESIVFTNTSTEATSYQWSFGDGTTSTDESPTKTYTATGDYQVSLTATGPGGADQATQAITIEAGDEIYFIDYSEGLIQKFAVNNPDNMTTFLNVTGFGGPGLAYDATHGKIYFSDFEVTGEGKIWSTNVDSPSPDDIVTGLSEPYSIAVDEAGGKIYYADGAADLATPGSDVSYIYRANLDGSGAEPIVTMTGALFRPLALDLVNDKMYFYDVQAEILYISNLKIGFIGLLGNTV